MARTTRRPRDLCRCRQAMFGTDASVTAKPAFAVRTLTGADQLSNGIAAVHESAFGTKQGMRTASSAFTQDAY
jgi:hypothetical protein